MLPTFNFSDICCCKTGFAATGAGQVNIGQDFVYNWKEVDKFAEEANINFASYITMPIAAKLAEKSLASPVIFLYTPLDDMFVVTVCSKSNADFMDPLHELPGYLEYGSCEVRPTARPIVYWDGTDVFHLHPVYEETQKPNLVVDYGSLFGCSATSADGDTYREMLNNPYQNFEYFAVPDKSKQEATWNGQTLTINHALCVMDSE